MRLGLSCQGSLAVLPHLFSSSISSSPMSSSTPSSCIFSYTLLLYPSPIPLPHTLLLYCSACPPPIPAYTHPLPFLYPSPIPFSYPPPAYPSPIPFCITSSYTCLYSSPPLPSLPSPPLPSLPLPFSLCSVCWSLQFIAWSGLYNRAPGVHCLYMARKGLLCMLLQEAPCT